MEHSRRLQTGWRPWLPFLSLLAVSLVLLLLEQAQVGRGLWSLANLTSRPGYWTVSAAQDFKTQSLDFIFWRERVVRRVAELEKERLDQQSRQAELSIQIQNLQSAQAIESLSSSGINFAPDQWTEATWQGFSGAWQVNRGCEQGMQVGDPVATRRGVLVGEVTQVKASYSLVKSWESLDWRVPVRVGTSSALAVVQAHPTGVTLDTLQWPAPVRDGDIIFSAGNQTLPRGLVVGEVSALQSQEAYGEATSLVTTPFRVSDLELVYVPKREGSTCQI